MVAAVTECSVAVLNGLDGKFSLKEEQTTALKLYVDKKCVCRTSDRTYRPTGRHFVALIGCLRPSITPLGNQK
ncbi:hypothetical protein DVA76_17585 [Acinetobacter baumannii]|nr:hypothetical protein DVA76_17585 [Acinetobacter baumannii]